jgi:LysM repeat protein
MNPAKFTGTPKKMYQDDPQRRYGGLTSNMGKVKPATGSGTATLRPTTGAPSSKPKTKSENKKTNKLASDRYTAMAAAYGNKPSGNKPSGNKPSGNKPSGNKPIATPASVKGYRVKSGDTLWDIAQKNNTTLTTIYKLNPELKKRRDAGKVDIFANTLVRLPKK